MGRPNLHVHPSRLAPLQTLHNPLHQISRHVAESAPVHGVPPVWIQERGAGLYCCAAYYYNYDFYFVDEGCF